MQNVRETCMRTTFSFIFGTKSGSRTGAPSEKKLGSACNVYNMYFIYCSYDKNVCYVQWCFKTNPRLKNSNAPRPRPPVLKFLYPPLGTNIFVFPVLMSAIRTWKNLSGLRKLKIRNLQ